METRRVMLILPKRELIVGRQHIQNQKPDIDLSMWGAFHKGVSRQHARFSLDAHNKLMLTDLGSANGTLLNGTLLVAGRLYEVHDGDLIAFGGLSVRLYYQDTIEVDL
jgi:pSer/pThr/pTyr-binding forkhead associated (FHA) protein